MESTGRRRRLAWTAVLFSTVAVGGAALQARGALVPSFETAFGVSESQLGLLTPVATLGFVGPVVVVGTLAGRIDIERTVVIGLLLSGAGLVLIGTAPSYVALLAFVAVQSAAAGIIRGLDRPILSHLHPTRRGRVFTLETMTWAVGATAGPFVVTWALAVADWRAPFYVLGAAFLPLAFAAWRLDLPEDVAGEQSLSREDFRPLLSNPTILAMGMGLVLVGGLESTFFTWLPYYATGFLSRSSANLALSVYLAAYVPGRLGFSFLADRVSPPDAVLASSVVVAAVVGVLFVVGGFARLPFYALVFLAGAFVSGFFPLLLTWGVEVAPDYTGPVNAAALVSAQMGFLTVPALVGVLADVYSIGAAMLVQVVLAGALVALLGGRRLLGLRSASG